MILVKFDPEDVNENGLYDYGFALLRMMGTNEHSQPSSNILEKGN
jgi:hypothetical protein